MKHALLMLSCIALTSCIETKVDGVKIVDESPQLEIGRYQIYDTEGARFMLDTKTGDSWRFVMMYNEKGELLTAFWSLMIKFDNGRDELSYIDMVEGNGTPPTEEELLPEY